MFKHSFKRTFFTGLIIISPLLVTLWSVRLFVHLIEDLISPFLHYLVRWLDKEGTLLNGPLAYAIPVLSVATAILGIYLVGIIGGNVLGKELFRLLESLVLKVPLVRSIYSTIRQLIDTLTSVSGDYSRVVFIEYPRAGVYTLGFVTNNDPLGLPKILQQQKMVAVFLPTTPNPTSGWLAYIPEDKVLEVNITIEQAFKLIVSGGVINDLSQHLTSPSSAPPPTAVAS